MAAPNVTLYLEGMILLFFEDGDFVNGAAESCQVGILRNAPEHIYEIRVLKKGVPPDGLPEETIYEEEDIRFTLALKVDDAMSTRIEFEEWSEDFDRLRSSASERSFNWVLDLEREIYPRKVDGIGANRKQFRSILRLDTGTFFTAIDELGTGGGGLSLNDLLICDEHSNPMRLIGRVATRVGVNITLHTTGSTAKFYNGTEVLFEAGEDDEYVVSINRTRPREMATAAPHVPGGAHTASHHNRDANNFYNAIGQELSPNEKVYFVSTAPEDIPPAGPEAACLVAMMGISEV